MRSLYTDDIAGASPRIRHFEKKLFRQRYSIPNPGYNNNTYQLSASQTIPNTQVLQNQSMIQLAKSSSPDNSGTYLNWTPVKLDSRQSRLRSEQRSRHSNQKLDNNSSYLVNNIFPDQHYSSNLSQIGRKSISIDKPPISLQIPQPYFPHYFNPYKDHNKNLFTGRRDWNPEKSGEVVVFPMLVKSTRNPT